MIPIACYHPTAAAAGTASTNTRWSRRLRMKQSCHVHLLNPLAKCPEGSDASLTPGRKLRQCWRSAASRPAKNARMRDDPATLAQGAGHTKSVQAMDFLKASERFAHLAKLSV